MGDTDVRDRLATSLGVTYALGRELGDGGASRVFVAHDVSLGRDVIVKVLDHALAEGLSSHRFAREIRVVARLQHPHIVPVLSAGTTAEGLSFCIMPFVRGESLRARLMRERPAVEDGVCILRDVLRALAYAHAHGIVHREIKPDNVLLSSDAALAIDFGIAKALRASLVRPRADADSDGTVTRAGTSHGTPAYMGPGAGRRRPGGRPPRGHLRVGSHPIRDPRRARPIRRVDVAQAAPRGPHDGHAGGLPPSPTPGGSNDGAFSLFGVPGTFSQGATTTQLTGALTFYVSGGGGFTFREGGGGGPLILDVSGPQVFSGTTARPTLTLGTFSATGNAGPGSVSTSTIAAVSTVPEPGTWALFGTGLLMVGGIAARRQSTTV